MNDEVRSQSNVEKLEKSKAKAQKELYSGIRQMSLVKNYIDISSEKMGILISSI